MANQYRILFRQVSDYPPQDPHEWIAKDVPAAEAKASVTVEGYSGMIHHIKEITYYSDEAGKDVTLTIGGTAVFKAKVMVAGTYQIVFPLPITGSAGDSVVFEFSAAPSSTKSQYVMVRGYTE